VAAARDALAAPWAGGLPAAVRSDALHAIQVSSVSKTFRLPKERETTVKERLVRPLAQRPHEVLQALDDISLQIRRGEFFGIVGRNGSGKSTLLRCIAGIYVPDSGTIAVEGRLAPFIELSVGFDKDLPARENVIQMGVLFGLDRREAAARFPRIIEFAELERFAAQKLKNYSSGMTARLAYAVTTHVDADVFLFDEVLAVGDAAFRTKCEENFDRLRAEGKTIVLVTHDLTSIQKYCDRALLLHHGRTVGLGEPAAIVEEYGRLTNEPRPRPVRVESEPKTPSRLAQVAAAVGTRLRSVVVAGGKLVAPPLHPSSLLGAETRRILVLTRMLAVSDFRQKYLDAALSYLWALARPAALFGILLLFFGAMGRWNQGVLRYPAYLMLGVIFWTFFHQTTNTALYSLTRRSDLLRKLPLPRFVVPFSAVLASALDLAMNFVIVLVVVFASGATPGPGLLELPLLFGVTALFATGLGLLLSALYVRHRDLDQVWAVVSQALFYLTPIFYAVTHLPAPAREIIVLGNPLATVLSQARHSVVDSSAPSAAELAGSPVLLVIPLGITLATLALGLWVFKRESPRAPELV
jgi:ABC-type polysaccharide/polyol phosphate transport system ATPase subunit/ABC-type polysaccharide/polyol phosphate export permease